jgi:hypothetical protein
MLVKKLDMFEERMEKQATRGNERTHMLIQEVERLHLDAGCIHGFTRGCLSFLSGLEALPS